MELKTLMVVVPLLALAAPAVGEAMLRPFLGNSYKANDAKDKYKGYKLTKDEDNRHYNLYMYKNGETDVLPFLIGVTEQRREGDSVYKTVFTVDENKLIQTITEEQKFLKVAESTKTLEFSNSKLKVVINDMKGTTTFVQWYRREQGKDSSSLTQFLGKKYKMDGSGTREVWLKLTRAEDDETIYQLYLSNNGDVPIEFKVGIIYYFIDTDGKKRSNLYIEEGTQLRHIKYDDIRRTSSKTTIYQFDENNTSKMKVIKVEDPNQRKVTYFTSQRLFRTLQIHSMK